MGVPPGGVEWLGRETARLRGHRRGGGTGRQHDGHGPWHLPTCEKHPLCVQLALSESKGFSPAPDFDVDRVRDQFLSGMGDGGSRGHLANPSHYSIERAMRQGSPLLLITVDEPDLSHKPCHIVDRGVQGGSYKRVDDVDVPLSANEIYSLETADMLTAFDRQTVDDAFGSDLDEDLLSQAFKKAS